MGNALFQAICRTGIFMICAQAIVHFRPHESYEKYFKLLVSIMILIQIFIPLGNFVVGFGSSEVSGQLAGLQTSLEQGMEEAREQAERTDKMLEEMTLEEVRRRMAEQGALNVETPQPLQEQTDVRQSGEQESMETETVEIKIAPIEQVGIE